MYYNIMRNIIIMKEKSPVIYRRDKDKVYIDLLS